MVESEDPTVVRSIAVTAEDVVTALAATRRSGRDTVLRVTPPFSGRMRARLHEAGTEPDTEPTGIHVDPASLIADTAPDYPDPAETEDQLRSDPDREYTRERHRARHADAVETWREAIPDHITDTVTLTTSEGTHEVAVTVLG